MWTAVFGMIFCAQVIVQRDVHQSYTAQAYLNHEHAIYSTEKKVIAQQDGTD